LCLPFLLIQGSADRLVDTQGARLFFERVASADKQHRVYEGAFHEVHNDICQQQALNDLAQWLAQRVTRNA
jgi:acylglycerol lipase